MPKQGSAALSPSLLDVGIFLFFACLLSTKNVYSFGLFLLFVGSVLQLRSQFYTSQRNFAAAQPDPTKVLVCLLTLIFLYGSFLVWFHHNPLRNIDLLSRYLLLIPLICALTSARVSTRILFAAFAVGAASSLYLVFQQYGGIYHSGRVYGYTGAIQFGNISLAFAAFCFAGLLTQLKYKLWSKRYSMLLALGLGASCVACLTSGSRGGWVSLPLLLLILHFSFANKINYKSYLTLAFTFSIIATALWNTQVVQSRFDVAQQDIEAFSQGNPNTSIGARLAMWQAKWVLIQEHPLLGLSESAQNEKLEMLVSTQQASEVVLNLANSHNNYIEIWVNSGVIGLLLMLSLNFYCLLKFLKKLRSTEANVKLNACCGSMLIVLYLVSNLTQNMMERNNTLLFFLVSLAVFWSKTFRENKT